MNAIDQLKSRLSPDHDDRQKLVRAIKSGNAGNLIIGEVLHNRASRNLTNEALEAWLETQGLKLPSKGTRSKYMRAYEAWVVNAGMSIEDTYEHKDFTDDGGQPIGMTLHGVSTYALYEARNLINRHDPAETLAFVYKNDMEDIRDTAKEATNDEPHEGWRTLKIPKGTMDTFKDLEVDVFQGKARTEVVAFLVMFVRDLWDANPEQMRATIDTYFGEGEDLDVSQTQEDEEEAV